MLTALRNNKSLTFYQTTEFRPKFSVDSSYTGGITATAISSTAYTTATVTTQFNNQLNAFLDAFHAERERIANKVAEGLAKDSEYTGARNDAVKLAWDYEKADVEMGGRGSSDWDDAQCQEIKETGKVRGAEGHHQKNVADHPEDQGDPDNIKFYKSRKEHLEKGHNGDFHNSSDAPKIDKDKMLKKTNSKRVFRNEIKGIGIAAAIGIGVGFTIGFAVSLAQTGVTPDSIKYACNGVQREHNKKLNNGLPILHKVPPKRDYGRYFCIMAEKGGTSHGGLTEKLSLFFHAKKQEVNAYGR